MEDVFETRLYPYQRANDQDACTPVRHTVAVIGAGPVGLSIAIDLALRGVAVVVLDENDRISTGSRAICFAKRTLEIADRLGCGAAMREKGVMWNLGKVFHEDRQVFAFNLLPEDGHKFPAFINLQQPYVERFMVERAMQLAQEGWPLSVRGCNRVAALSAFDDHVCLTVETPDGPYAIEADWVVACDGARSPTRQMMGLDFQGRVFEDNFLIADIVMKADFPTERWFWFEPSHKAGASTLLHKQPDNVWRVDFQIGWDVARDQELAEDNVRARLDAMLGPDVAYDIVWTSIYTFQCRRMERFRHDRVIFAGDAAHQLSPFGARGANSGIQDADNLAWKLALVCSGRARETLLDSYDCERVQAADENILNSTRATDFITPKSSVSHVMRNAVLDLAGDFAFARPLVNSGRLSVPCTYDGSPLNGADALEGGPARARPGSPCPDLALNNGYLLEKLGGGFTLLAIDLDLPRVLDGVGPPIAMLTLKIAQDVRSRDDLRARYLGEASRALYLIRPDQHVAARWSYFDETAVKAALARAIGGALS